MDECYGAVVPAAWTGWDDKGVKPTRSDGACHDLDPDPLHRLGVMRDALNASGAAVCVPACLYVCSSTYACLPAWGLPATAALGTRPFCALPATKWCPNCRHLPDKCPGNNPPAHRPDPTRPARPTAGRPIFFSNEFPAAHENYPGGKYNFTWMVQTHGRQMPGHANMWRISQDIGRCVHPSGHAWWTRGTSGSGHPANPPLDPPLRSSLC